LVNNGTENGTTGLGTYEGPASEVLRDLDTSQPQAYSLIWEALARRFGSLDGAREAMRRFDSRRQEENETIQDFEQALRTLHREAWPAATPEQRDAALKRRFEDGLITTEMTQFLRLHARDLYFHATVIKARQFAETTGQSKPKKRVNFIDTCPKSPAQPEWDPLLNGFKEMMTEALQPLQRALRTQTQGNAPRTVASTPSQSRPATPQLNPPPRGAWQNQQQRNGQGFRGGNANQSGGTYRGFFQPQGRNSGNSRPQTPPNSQRNQRQFQQRPTTPPMPARPRRGPGCNVCGDRRCHTKVHRRNGILPPDFRRIPPTWNNERNRGTASGLNANARVFTPSLSGRRQSSSGNSGGNPGSGNRVPPLQRPSSA